MYVFLFVLYLYKIYCVIYYHKLSDYLDGNKENRHLYPPNKIRIEAYCDLSGVDEFIGTRYAAGYFAWRDWINERGGICLSESGGTSGCTEAGSTTDRRIKVALKVIDWARGESTKSQLIYDQIKSVCSRPDEQKPHFIIGPYSTEYSQKIKESLIDYLKSNDGCNIPVFFNTEDDAQFDENISFQFSANPLITPTISSSMEYFSLRNDARTFAILGTSSGSGLYFAEQTLNIIRDYQSRNSDIQLLMLRCTNSVENVKSKSCKSDSDCGQNEKCTFARHSNDVLFPARYVEILDDWIYHISYTVQPDVVIFTEDYGISVVAEKSKIYKWRVKGVLIINSSGLKNYPLYPTKFWIYIIPFTRENQSGLADLYMGTTSQYISYISNKLDYYIFDPVPTTSSSSVFDIEFMGIGSLTGITIQRGIELSYVGKENERYDPSDPFSPISYNKLVKSIRMFGECGYNVESNGKISANGNYCTTDTDCGSVRCYEWNNYFGTVHFDKRGTNIGGNNILMQILDIDDSNITDLLSTIIGPSDIAGCNVNGDCAEARGWDCKCTNVYPAEFEWLPLHAELPFQYGTKSFFFLVILMSTISAIYLFLIIIITSNTKHVVVAELPPILYTLPLFSIITVPSIVFYSLHPSQIICYCRTALFCINGSIVLYGIICCSKILLIQCNNMFSLYDSENMNFLYNILLIIIASIVSFCLFPVHDSVEIISKGGKIYEADICSTTYFSYVGSTIILIYCVIALYYFMQLFPFRKIKLIKFLLIEIAVSVFMFLMITWVFEYIEIYTSEYQSLVGFLKSLSSIVIMTPYFVYTFTEMVRRKKVTIDQAADIKYIENLINRPISRSYIREFLKDYDLDHFIDFYNHVSFYRSMPPGIQKQIYEDFIYDTYITYGTSSISIPQNLLDDVQKKLRKNSPYIYDKAQKACLNTLQLSGKLNAYLLSYFSEYSRRLELLMTSMKDVDQHIKLVMKEICMELLKKKNNRIRRNPQLEQNM